MADVQTEHGYTKIADEILEAMARIKLSPTQYRVLFVVWRYTYGFNRKEHNLSLGFISNATGCDKRQLQREIKKLEERNVIHQRIKNGSYRIVTFNKNHDEWIIENIGETTIGEIDNGETDNGHSTNPTIGETVNGTIGEIDNQDIQETNLKTNYTSDFELFWKEYPRKVSKTVAFKKWKSLMKSKVSVDLIIRCTKNYAKTLKEKNTAIEYMLHPSTFLNDERYMDYEVYTPPFTPSNKVIPLLPEVNPTQEERDYVALARQRQMERNQQRNAAPR